MPTAQTSAHHPLGGTQQHDAFLERLEPLRGELTAYCYRMLGSMQDAEDLVQETYIRAWRAFDQFEARSSVRTWVYRIATNACLTALKHKERRVTPVGLGQPSADPTEPVHARFEVNWLEPLPDKAVWGQPAADPATDVVRRETVRLAFVAALQHLTAQQRATLVLREVFAWRASEVAEALGVSVAAVNSSLQRARAHLARLDTEHTPNGWDDGHTRGVVERYAAAFEDYDLDSIIRMLVEDAVWEMPPYPGWYQGSAAIRKLIATQCPADGPGDMRMIPTAANGQPALALYMRDSDGIHRAFQIHVLHVTDAGIAHVFAFSEPNLFHRFGLSEELSAQR